MWFLILCYRFYHTRMTGGFTMTHKLKDPGSAITHLIGMLLAAIVSIPLIIKSFSSGDYVRIISLTSDQQKVKETRPCNDLCSDRRFLYSDLYDRSWR